MSYSYAEILIEAQATFLRKVFALLMDRAALQHPGEVFGCSIDNVDSSAVLTYYMGRGESNFIVRLEHDANSRVRVHCSGKKPGESFKTTRTIAVDDLTPKTIFDMFLEQFPS